LHSSDQPVHDTPRWRLVRPLSSNPFVPTGSEPTPLDCLLVAHLYAIWHGLPPTSALRRALEVEPALRAYMDRLLTRLGAPAPEMAVDKAER
jgi:hypothetical protein